MKHWVVAFALLLIACGIPQSQVSLSTETATLVSPTLQIVEATPAVNVEQTVIVKPTPISPSPTPTILPTISTLPDEEAFALLSEMLRMDNSCELPCWLNITPGKSFYTDAYFEWSSFLQMAGTTKELPRDFLYYSVYAKDNNDIFIDTRIYLSPHSELIESIEISTWILRYIEIGKPDRIEVYDSQDYIDLLHSYLLPNMLSTYGPPDQILFEMEIIVAEPTSPDFFHIWLSYPTIGVILEYTGSAEVTGGIINGCPSDTFVSLWLVSPADAELFQNTFEEATGLPSSPFYKTSIDAIGMTIDEFYDAFKNPTSRCIVSPLNIWPEH